MAQERRIFLSADLPISYHPDLEGILGVAATWLPGRDVSTHPQLRVTPDWPIKEFWRAYSPLITQSWIYEFADPEGLILVCPPKPDGILARLAKVRAQFPEAALALHVIYLLCEGDAYSISYISPEVMAALAKAGAGYDVFTHYDRSTGEMGAVPGPCQRSGSSSLDRPPA